MSEPEKSNDELVEELRKAMQDTVDRGIEAMRRGENPFEAAGMPIELRSVAAIDLDEIGQFDLTLPPWANPWTRRHWVYRHHDGTVYVVGLPGRTHLRQLGTATLCAFVRDPKAVN